MTDYFEWMDAYYDWWIAFWYAHPILFLAMLTLSVAVAIYTRRHK